MELYIHRTLISNVYSRVFLMPIFKRNQIIHLDYQKHKLSVKQVIALCKFTADNEKIRVFYLKNIPLHDKIIDAFIHLVTTNTSIVQYQFHTQEALNPAQQKKLMKAFEKNTTFEAFYNQKRNQESLYYSKFSYRNKIMRIVNEIEKSVKDRNWPHFSRLLKEHYFDILKHIQNDLPQYSKDFSEKLNWCFKLTQLKKMRENNFISLVCNPRFPELETPLEPIRLHKEKLNAIYMSYRTQSWLGYFLQIISFGFYHHQSATMACLQKLIQDPKKSSFTFKKFASRLLQIIILIEKNLIVCVFLIMKALRLYLEPMM